MSWRRRPPQDATHRGLGVEPAPYVPGCTWDKVDAGVAPRPTWRQRWRRVAGRRTRASVSGAGTGGREGGKEGALKAPFVGRVQTQGFSPRSAGRFSLTDAHVMEGGATAVCSAAGRTRGDPRVLKGQQQHLTSAFCVEA
ncbi:hypothetical protein EYF80_059537 [Liparis tanakae]|uniref:Uncharacterized protein n=1 Tax=Liparis tanakae TaxID=230148 RepID=A0A4Z2EP37_9TELE|nr:hypothetical protein EYF80_059537 [Liparis tanakae]